MFALFFKESNEMTEIRPIESHIQIRQLPDGGEEVGVYSLSIEDGEGLISRFVVKLGVSKFGHPQLRIITRARKTGKKRERTLQSIPLDPAMWEKKIKKGKMKNVTVDT